MSVFDRLPLGTPTVLAQATPSRATTRAVQPFTLVDLIDDAAEGHPGQRLTFTRSTGGTYHAFYQPTIGPKYLVCRACVLRRGTYSPGDGVTYDLSITDGTTTISSSSSAIPAGLKADLVQYPGAVGLGTRFGSASYPEWYLSIPALIAAGLSSSAPWRFTLVVVCGTTAASEVFTMEECPRFVADDSETIGQVPPDFLPRGQIVDGSHGTERMLTTLREAMYSSLRTYHCRAVDPSAPWSTTGGSWGCWAGDTETGTTPLKWKVPVRKMRGSASNGARALWMVRYRITGASAGQKGYVRIVTGGASSPYQIDLTNVTGSWTDSPTGSLYLSTSVTDRIDTLYFEAKTDGGTLELCARGVWDNPA